MPVRSRRFSGVARQLAAVLTAVGVGLVFVPSASADEEILGAASYPDMTCQLVLPVIRP